MDLYSLHSQNSPQCVSSVSKTILTVSAAFTIFSFLFLDNLLSNGLRGFERPRVTSIAPILPISFRFLQEKTEELRRRLSKECFDSLQSASSASGAKILREEMDDLESRQKTGISQLDRKIKPWFATRVYHMSAKHLIARYRLSCITFKTRF